MSNRKFEIGIIIMPCLILIYIASPSGILSYFYTLILFSIFNHFCDKERRGNNLMYFHFYLLLALSMYFIQRMQLPNYMGLTGPEGGIGTDDVRYYAGLPNVKISYSTERMDIALDNPYTKFISALYPLKIINPIDIVVFNLLGITFLPYLTRKTADVFFNDNKVSRTAEHLILFCPFMMSIGLIIMRDIICTSLILAAFNCFARKKYLFFLIFLGVLAFLKFGFVVFLCVPLFVYIIYNGIVKTKGKMIPKLKYLIFTAGILFVFIIFIIPNLSSLTQGRLSSESLFRISFLDYLSDFNDQSILVKIYSLPILVRIPALIITFIVIPPITLNIFYDGIFIPKNLLQNVLAPIYWWFLYGYFFKFLLSFKKSSIKVKAVYYIIILLSLALGIISLQTRHKAALMPFIYIAIAYSIHNNQNEYKTISSILLTFFIIVQFIYCILAT